MDNVRWSEMRRPTGKAAETRTKARRRGRGVYCSRLHQVDLPLAFAAEMSRYACRKREAAAATKKAEVAHEVSKMHDRGGYMPRDKEISHAGAARRHRYRESHME
jgi:hypothetical protein